MKTFALTLLFTLASLLAIAQPAAEIKKLIKEGIGLHDKGDYDGAIKKYDEALKVDKDDFDANYEKAFSLSSAKRYDECIELCKSMTERFTDHALVKEVYSIWGSALDDKGKSEEAIKIFNKGLDRFPTYYLLHFNKGLTFMRLKKDNDAAESYIAALRTNPLHPSSNFYLGALLQNENRIASLLSYMFFIACEPQTKRSIQAHEAIQEILYRNIKKDGKSTTIAIDINSLKPKEKTLANDFSQAEFMFSLLGSMDNAKGIDSIANTPAAKFDFRLQLLIGSLKNDKKENKGYYWERLVPFFQELKEKHFSIVLSNLIYLSKDIQAQLWVENNKEKIDSFYTWLKNRKWSE